jgi:hypothetical protein
MVSVHCATRYDGGETADGESLTWLIGGVEMMWMSERLVCAGLFGEIGIGLEWVKRWVGAERKQAKQSSKASSSSVIGLVG